MNAKTLWTLAGIATGVVVIAVIAYFLFGYNTSTTYTNSNKNTATVNANGNSNVNAAANKNTNATVNTNANTNAEVNTNSDTNVNVSATTDETETTNANSNVNSNTNTTATNTSSTNASTAPSVAATVPATGWVTYENARYGFSISYPESMAYLTAKEEVGFYPFGEKDDTDQNPVWFVSVYNSATHSLDDLIAAVGNTYNDRKETKESVTVGGLDATKVTVTSGTNSTVKAVVIYIEKNGRYFEISNGGTDSTDYTTFYSSFAF